MGSSVDSKNAQRLKGVKYVGTLTDGQIWKFDNASGTMIPGSDGNSTNLGIDSKTATQLDVTSDTGTNATIPEATATEAGLLSVAKRAEIIANNAKVSDINHNVSTDLSEGTTTNTSVDVNSSDGLNATLASATTLRAGLLSKGKFDEVVANTLKVSDINHNVSTDLSEGTTTNTSVDVNSSDGTNATLAEASTTRAGVLSKAKFDEIVLNNAKVTNVTTDLSHLADATQISLNSSDGADTTLVGANATLAGLLTVAKRAEIIANTLKVTFPEAPNDGTQYARKNLGWEAAAGGSTPRVQLTGDSSVTFVAEEVYNTATTPLTGNLTVDQTGAVLGVVQKLYHNDATPPTITGVSDVQIMGDGVYFTNEINIIYFEWTETNRVEYWIVQEQ